jgi:transposase InsO family protein
MSDIRKWRRIHLQRVHSILENHDIKIPFSSPRSPQHSGVVERKNKTIQEASRIMLNEAKIPDKLWIDVIYTKFHILNRAHLRPNHDKTLYELWFGRPASVKHFRTFGSKYYIKNDEHNLAKFDPSSNEGIFLGYSYNKKAYICYNIRLLNIVENANVKIDD